jgi:phospholipid/cholesterol/gamma-HCH transport system permease protein
MEAAVKETAEPLDVVVSEAQGRLVVRLRGILEAADVEDVRRAFLRLPPVAGRLVAVQVDPQAIKTRGAIVLDRFCRFLESAGARVRIDADEPTSAALASHAAMADGPRRAPEAGFLDRVVLYRRAVSESAIRYLTTFRRTLATSFGGLVRRVRFDAEDFLLAVMQGGVGALPLVVLISALVGAILALQAGPFFARFGQEMLVAQLVALSVLREIGPLLTAILIAGRSGSSLAAEIGTMKVSEEIDALEAMGTDPVRVLIAPRFLGLLCALPCLVIVADIVGVAGGLIVGKFVLGIPVRVYLDQTRQAVELKDVVGGLIKAIAYAIVIVTIAGHQGFSTSGGAAGVGRNTTRSVVLCILWIIVVDMFFTWMLYVLDL